MFWRYIRGRRKVVWLYGCMIVMEGLKVRYVAEYLA